MGSTEGWGWLEEEDMAVFSLQLKFAWQKKLNKPHRKYNISTFKHKRASYLWSVRPSKDNKWDHQKWTQCNNAAFVISVPDTSDEELSPTTPEPGTIVSPYRPYTCNMRVTQTQQWLPAAELVDVMDLSFSPAVVQCPTCQQQVTTEIQHKVGKTSFLLCYLSTLLGWVTVPHYVKSSSYWAGLLQRILVRISCI